MTDTTENRLPTAETTETAMPVSVQLQAAADTDDAETTRR